MTMPSPKFPLKQPFLHPYISHLNDECFKLTLPCRMTPHRLMINTINTAAVTASALSFTFCYSPMLFRGFSLVLLCLKQNRIFTYLPISQFE